MSKAPGSPRLSTVHLPARERGEHGGSVDVVARAEVEPVFVVGLALEVGRVRFEVRGGVFERLQLLGRALECGGELKSSPRRAASRYRSFIMTWGFASLSESTTAVLGVVPMAVAGFRCFSEDTKGRSGPSTTRLAGPLLLMQGYDQHTRVRASSCQPITDRHLRVVHRGSFAAGGNSAAKSWSVRLRQLAHPSPSLASPPAGW